MIFLWVCVNVFAKWNKPDVLFTFRLMMMIMIWPCGCQQKFQEIKSDIDYFNKTTESEFCGIVRATTTTMLICSIIQIKMQNACCSPNFWLSIFIASKTHAFTRLSLIEPNLIEFNWIFRFKIEILKIKNKRNISSRADTLCS